MKIVVLFPAPARKPVGGYKIVYSYINRILQKNRKYTCTFLYPVDLIEGNKYKTLLKTIYFKYFNKKFFSWSCVSNNNLAFHVIGLDENIINEADIVIVTAVETAIYLKEKGLDKNKKVMYFIQHFEDWSVSTNKVIQTYHYGFKNIVVSKWLKNILIRNDAPVALHLPNPVDEIFRKKISIENRVTKSILFLYHESLWKGSKELIEALYKLQEKDNNIIFSCFSAFKKPSNFPKWINFYHNPTRELLVDLYNQHTFFISSSYKEGYGLPPAEAMRCGACVLSTQSGGIDDFAIHNETAYLVSSPPNPDEILNAILKLFNNDKLVYKIAFNGYKKIQKFSWDKNVDKLLRLIDE